MDARWKWSKVCDIVVTPLGLWMLTGSGETPARYLYMHLVKNIYLSQTYIIPKMEIPTQIIDAV
jgi:hypothetical protein